MGYYLNPPERVLQVGRELTHPFDYSELLAQIPSTECLVALGDRGMFKFAGLCYSEREYQAFASQFNSLLSLQFYAVPKSEFPEYFAEEIAALESMPNVQIQIPAEENFRDTRHFTLAQILNITTGIFCSDDFGDVYDVLNFMTSDDLMTHQLPRAGEKVKPYILNRHPQLKAITQDMLYKKPDVKQIVKRLTQTYGNSFGLYPIDDSEYAPKEPMQELMDMLGKLDSPIG